MEFSYILFPFFQTVIDQETWIFDLDKANNEGVTSWYKLYNMREAYNMTDLSPASYHEVAQRIATDKDTWDQYLRYIERMFLIGCLG
jgi:hypothetical protein